MTKVFIALFGILLSFSVFAEPIESEDYTCADLQSLVQEEGSVEVDVFLGHITVSADRDSCDIDERAEVVNFRTSDQRRCPAGYRCVFVPIH